jgi:L-erythro-3,5-diaminohexanoate dehydrogenase
MFIGRVARIGEALRGRIDLQEGDKIASLVSLSLTPLRIDEILAIRRGKRSGGIKGQAILFESAIWAKLPEDLDEKLALAVLDVAGAPAQVAKLVKPGDTVLVVGANGKSGLLCCYEAKKRAGITGKIIAGIRRESARPVVAESGFADEIILADADDALRMLAEVERVTGGALADVVINCVSREKLRMGSILPCKDGGLVYFFSMATNFTKAALGAEGVGKDVTMIIGNGYTKNHAAITLNLRANRRTSSGIMPNGMSNKRVARGGEATTGAEDGGHDQNKCWAKVPKKEWTDWKWQMRNRIGDVAELRRVFPEIEDEEAERIDAVLRVFRMAITPYYAGLIDIDNPTCDPSAGHSPAMNSNPRRKI